MRGTRPLHACQSSNGVLRMKRIAPVRSYVARVVVAAAVLVTSVSTASAAASATTKCAQTISSATAKLTKAKSGALAKCAAAKIAAKLTAATDCREEEKTAAAITKAVTKHAAAIAKACGGKDKACGGDTADEVAPSAVGFGASCPNIDGGSCNNTIADCGGIATCLACIGGRAVDAVTDTAVAELALGTDDKALQGCQAAIAKATNAFAVARAKALRKCWSLRLAGKHANACPDPGDGKVAAAIAKARTKLHDAICKACAGDDHACGTADDLSPSAIGFATTCPAFTVPNGGGDCGAIGPVGSLDQLDRCVACFGAH